MRCPKCNQENPDGGLFCSSCGEVLGNLSEEDARMAAVLRPSGPAPSMASGPGTPNVPVTSRTTPGFGFATISFAMSVIFFTAALLIYIYYFETIVLGDHTYRDLEHIDLVVRAFSYTLRLGFMAMAAGLALILLVVSGRQRRGEAVFWPASSRIRTAAFVALITLVMIGIELGAMAVIREMDITQGTWIDLIQRVEAYTGSVSYILLATAAYLAARSLEGSGPGRPTNA